MNNSMTIDGYTAVIAYDPDIEMFRGEFMGLNGGADFYAKDVEGLRQRGRNQPSGVQGYVRKRWRAGQKAGKWQSHAAHPTRSASSRAVASRAQGTSLNQWAAKVLAGGEAQD
jgi:predicted HicB family RNase H-like nuclease